ncbi:MAG: hypothetical protein FJW94_04530 [Actinobacteria bacterium]|nr:hypothetical protein [Actinomycetota bacterium]
MATNGLAGEWAEMDTANVSDDAPTVALPAGFAELLDRSFAGVVGLVRRVSDPSRSDPASLRAAVDIAVEVFAWARIRNLGDTDAGLTRVVRRALDRSLPLLTRPAHLCPLPVDLVPADLLDADLLTPETVTAWSTVGLSSQELRTALNDVDRNARRVGLATLGAQLTLEDTSALLDLRGDEALDALAEVAEQLTAHRRSSLRPSARTGAS